MDDELPYEDRTTALRSAVGDLALAMDQLRTESHSTAMSTPSYLTVPPDPPLPAAGIAPVDG